MSESDKKLRVLIADDDNGMRTLLVRMLSRAGYEIVEVSDGRDAVQHLDDTSFDAVVLDLMMPGLDAVGVLNHMSRTHPHMPERTVVVTSFPRTASLARLEETCTVVQKPFELADLIAAVRHCAEKPR